MTEPTVGENELEIASLQGFGVHHRSSTNQSSRTASTAHSGDLPGTPSAVVESPTGSANTRWA